MIDWQDKVIRPTLRCHATQREIQPGEAFYSALLVTDDHFVRWDFSAEAWEEHKDQPQFISWWRLRRPPAQEDSGPRLVNNAVLLGIFNDLRESRDRRQQCFAWLLALLLMRAKRLRYRDLVHEGDEAYLLLEEKEAKLVHRVRDPRMSPDEEQQVQEDLEGIFEIG